MSSQESDELVFLSITVIYSLVTSIGMQIESNKSVLKLTVFI